MDERELVVWQTKILAIFRAPSKFLKILKKNKKKLAGQGGLGSSSAEKTRA
ncbi:MAG: hypothetical protein RLZZ282_1035 [Verrucomicrobiota bacterium]|jgi:hypothetical protein